jgi:hypothetical protein
MVAASIDWYAGYQPGWALLLVTLTYPGDWRAAAPTPDHVTRHRKAFGLRFLRATGYVMGVLWKREFQERGAPHPPSRGLVAVGHRPGPERSDSMISLERLDRFQEITTGSPNARLHSGVATGEL